MISPLRQKKYEKSLIEFVRQYWPDAIPPGVIEQPDPPAPDICVRQGDQVLGVEITKLYQPRQQNDLQPVQVESGHKQALASAHEKYSKLAPDNLFVNASFVTGRLPPVHVVADALVQIVMKNKPAPGGKFSGSTYDSLSRLGFPDWLQGLLIIPVASSSEAKWIGGSVWSTLSLTHEQIADAIRKKNLKLDGYREAADHVWLLVVCDLFPMAASFSVPQTAAGWSFSHSFDKILLLARSEHELFEF